MSRGGFRSWPPPERSGGKTFAAGLPRDLHRFRGSPEADEARHLQEYAEGDAGDFQGLERFAKVFPIDAGLPCDVF